MFFHELCSWFTSNLRLLHSQKKIEWTKNMLSNFCPVCPQVKIHGHDIWVTPKFPCIAVSCCITKLFQTAAQWGWLRFILSYWKIGALRNTTASSCMLELINGQNIVESLRSSSSSKGQNTGVQHLSHPKISLQCCIVLYHKAISNWGYMRFIPRYWNFLLQVRCSFALFKILWKNWTHGLTEFYRMLFWAVTLCDWPDFVLLCYCASMCSSIGSYVAQ